MCPDSNSEISISHVGSFLTTVQGGGFQSVASGLRYQLLVSFQLFTPKQETSDAGCPQKPQKKTKIIHRKWQRGRPTDTKEIRADSAAGLSELGGVFFTWKGRRHNALHCTSHGATVGNRLGVVASIGRGMFIRIMHHIR